MEIIMEDWKDSAVLGMEIETMNLDQEKDISQMSLPLGILVNASFIYNNVAYIII
jgi:hypothetical protein